MATAPLTLTSVTGDEMTPARFHLPVTQHPTPPHAHCTPARHLVPWQILNDADAQIIFEPFDEDFTADGILEVQILGEHHPAVLHEAADELDLMGLDVIKATVHHSVQPGHAHAHDEHHKNKTPTGTPVVGRRNSGNVTPTGTPVVGRRNSGNVPGAAPGPASPVARRRASGNKDAGKAHEGAPAAALIRVNSGATALNALALAPAPAPAPAPTTEGDDPPFLNIDMPDPEMPAADATATADDDESFTQPELSETSYMKRFSRSSANWMTHKMHRSTGRDGKVLCQYALPRCRARPPALPCSHPPFPLPPLAAFGGAACSALARVACYKFPSPFAPRPVPSP